ncbi:unnamed protein product [Adineta ricciae]|uniref:Uncharacterized protein n=1 Tax=Adineta ricciae TaxID=249248 RepID=A0A815K4A4_ADIRI|nr:unnamed protein product [Adineta ricciae]
MQSRMDPMKLTSHVNSPAINKSLVEYAERKFRQLVSGLSKFEQQIGLSMIHDWYRNERKQQVIEKWKQPKTNTDVKAAKLTILHYNIRHFYSNQCDLLDMITHRIPMIISLNEFGSPIPEKTIKQLLFSYNIVMKAGTNSHGGVVLAINKKLNEIPINSPESNIVAAEITINDETFIIASIYSPRNEKLSL